MKDVSAKLMMLASVVLLGLFFFPIWKVKLIAPQYPEGLTMIIYFNKIVGGHPSDLNNINLLNHYIGMSPINPSALIELKIMPYLVEVMIGFAALAAITKFNKLRWVWVITMIVYGIVGLADFHAWEHQYGYHLSSYAPIKIPGMHYEPPFIGSKQFLNITALSYPDVSFYLAILSVIFGIGSLYVTNYGYIRNLFSRIFGKGQSKTFNIFFVALISIAMSSILSCCAFHNASKPEAINYGKDTCAHCSMTIVDPRYFAEIVTDKGKVFRFDSIACLSSFAQAQKLDVLANWHIWVADYSHPGSFIDARQALYVNDQNANGPMYIALQAFGSASEAKQFNSTMFSFTDWSGVANLVNSAKLMYEQCATKS